GDRIRMQDHATDEGVFIRSMATRGHLGGLSLATPQAVRILDAAGKPWIIIETVGVGQVEVEVAGAADTTVVVVNPRWGDGVQANKAGLLEIADVLVVNKADRDGAADTVRDLEMMLELAGDRDWRPPIVQTVATDSRGVDDLTALPPGALPAWTHPSFQLWLAERLGTKPGSRDLVMAAPATDHADLELTPRDDLGDHDRVRRAARYRADLRVFTDAEELGV